MVGLSLVGAGEASPAGASPAATTAGTVLDVTAGTGAGRAHNVSQVPTGLVATAGGTVYVADAEGYLRSLTQAKSDESYVAGSPLGSAADGAPATKASLSGAGELEILGLQGFPSLSMTEDPAGDLVFASPATDVVRILAGSTGTRYGLKLTKGDVYTLAGTLERGSDGTLSGAGGPAASAVLDGPAAVAVDASGNVLIADTGDNVVEVVAIKTGTFYQQSMTAGHLYVIAGTGTPGDSVPGTPAVGSDLDAPDGLAVTASGIAIANDDSDQIDFVANRRGTAYGVDTPNVGDSYLIADAAGQAGSNGDGGSALTADLDGPSGLAVDSTGDLFVADTGNHRVRVIAATKHTIYGTAATTGDIYAVAGTGTMGGTGNNGKAVSAELEDPLALAVDNKGNLLIGDDGLDNVVLVAAAKGTAYGQTTLPDHLYYIAGDGLVESSGYDAPAIEAENNGPIYDSVAADGDIAVADLGAIGASGAAVRPAASSAGAALVQRITAAEQRFAFAAAGAAPLTSAPDGPGVTEGRIRVVAATTGDRFGIHMVAGDIYTVAGGARATGSAPDGQLATDYGFGEDVGAAYDHHGNLVVTDDALGYVDVVAATTGTWYGLKMTAGHIYHLAGAGGGTILVRPSSLVPTGTPELAAALDYPSQVAVDADGNVVVGLLDGAGGDVVDVIAVRTGTAYGQQMTAGDVYTIAGTPGSSGDTGDGGPATAAELDAPYGVAVDAKGDVAIDQAISDQGGAATVRFVPATTGRYFGQQMTAGDIYTIAGSATASGSGIGNNGPAREATLGGSGGLAFSADGSLLVADLGNNEVRLVAASGATRFGQAMTTGDIYAIAGDGRRGPPAYGVKGTSSPEGPGYGVAAEANGNVVFDGEATGNIATVVDATSTEG